MGTLTLEHGTPVTEGAPGRPGTVRGWWCGHCHRLHPRPDDPHFAGAAEGASSRANALAAYAGADHLVELAQDLDHAAVAGELDWLTAAREELAHGERLGDWLQIGDKRAVWPLDPRPEDIRVAELAHAQAQENRYGGRAPWPYPVGQHARLVSLRAEQLARELGWPEHSIRELARSALMHDAPEAPLKDIPAPFKGALRVWIDNPGAVWSPRGRGQPPRAGWLITYKELENRWAAVICEALRLPISLDHPLIKRADLELLATEAAQFFPEHTRPFPWLWMPEPINLTRVTGHPLIQRESFEQTRDLYLERWNALGGGGP